MQTHRPTLDGASLLSLRIFITVAEAQSFSAAARQLRLSASAVTNHVLGLERMLGVALFHRTTRTVAINEAGERFYEQSMAILAQVDEALQLIAPSSEPVGRLRVLAPPAFALRVIGPHLGGFLKANPGVNIEMMVSSATPNIIADHIDIAFQLRQEPGNKLGHVLVAGNSRAFCATESYLEKYGKPESPTDLTQHRCLMNMVAGGAEPWAYRVGREVRHIQVDGPMLSDNGEMLRLACLAGIGIGNFHRFHVQDDLDNGRLVEIMSDYQPDTNRIYALTPHREMMRPLTKTFLDFVQSAFARQTARALQE